MPAKKKQIDDKIHFIITGGTIDSKDSEIPFPSPPFEKSVIPQYMKNLRSDYKFNFSVVCLKDSRSLTKMDIKKIYGAIKKSKCRQIIITGGTYAMPDVARFLEANMRGTKKTIILTGSMLPIYGFPMSDGPFNLGYSVAMLRELPAGVYVCMNGKIFSPGEVLKYVSEGRFESIFSLK